MWPHVVQFETRRLQMEREHRLAREIEAAARVRLETTSDLPWRLVVAKAISDSKEVGR